MRFYSLLGAVCLIFSGVQQVHAQCCDHTLVMQDSYGDGWSGGFLELRRNGATVGIYAASGSGSSVTFDACTGDQLQLIYTAGNWEEDNTYQLFGPAGNVLFADGPAPAVGMVWTGATDCAATVDPGSVPCAAWPIDTAECVLVNNVAVLGTGISPGCANYAGGDLWYGMTVPASGNIIISSQDAGGLDDTGIALWTGPDCLSLTLRACDDDAGDGAYSRIVVQELKPGHQLIIQVFGYDGATGAFELCVSDPGSVQLESSELPIVLINTQGQVIPSNGRIDALMEIKYNGPGNLTNINDPSNEYSGHIGIGVRGASSSGYPQKPFKVETRTPFGENNNVAILGMPQENDWVLLSNYNDRSLLRNSLAFELSRSMGQYAPRTRLCEVLIDSVYRGIYVLGEKIKRDNGRVDIATLNVFEIAGDDLTGGYILQQNLRGSNDSFLSNFSPIDHPGLDVHFLYEYPEPDLIAAEQRSYIAAFVDTLETALYSAQFADPLIGYRKYLDVPSFITYFLINEVARNNDGFKKSIFYHKDKNSNGGKLKAGPVWDFDWAWKEIQECGIIHGPNGSGWAHRINDCPTDNNSSGWYIRLLQDSTFANELRCTYEFQRLNALSEASINAFIDSVGSLVQNAQARHFQKWPILGMSGPAPESGPFGATYVEDLAVLKQWIATRLNWLDENMPGECLGVAVAERTSNGALTCYPNPSTGLFWFQGELKDGGVHWLTIRDVASRVIDRVQLSGGTVSIDRSITHSGSYFYTVEREGQVVQQGKLIVL